MMFNHIDLFSGVGGFALAAREVWGDQHNVVTFCEINPYCQTILQKHWPNVPINKDIRGLNYEFIADTNKRGHVYRQTAKQSAIGNDEAQREPKPGVEPSDVQTPADANGKRLFQRKYKERSRYEKRQLERYRRPYEIDLLTGGFPCQPFSNAGKKRGTEDDRYLWPEMLRVIKELRPRWIIGENVAGLINMAEWTSESEVEGNADFFDEDTKIYERVGRGILYGIINDIEQQGYEVQAFVIPACAVGAPHRRDRIWIVANSNDVGRDLRSGDREERQVQNIEEREIAEGQPERNGRGHRACSSDKDAPDAERERGGQGNGEGMETDTPERTPCTADAERCGEDDTDATGEGLERRAGKAQENGRGRPSGEDIDDTDANGLRLEGTWPEQQAERDRQDGEDVADSNSQGLERRKEKRDVSEEGQEPGDERPVRGYPDWNRNWVEVATKLCVHKLAHGLPKRVVRLADGTKLTMAQERVEAIKALGNAIVPQVVMEIMRAIKEVDGK